MKHKKYAAIGAAGIALICALPGAIAACSSDGDQLNGDNTYGTPSGGDGSTSTNGGKDGSTDPVGVTGDSDGGGVMTVPFEPVPPSVYVAKVKNLMTGMPVTDADIATVAAGKTDADKQNALRTLVQGWMMLPAFQTKMIGFFRNAFQQNQVDMGTLLTNLGGAGGANLGPSNALFVQNLEDSFALTAWDTVSNKRPFNSNFTTSTYMLTTAMKVFLAYLDEFPVDDNGRAGTSRLVARNQLPTGFVLDPNSTNTLAQTLDKTNTATFMHWPFPINKTKCTGVTTYPPLAIGATGAAAGDYATLFNFIFGLSTVKYPDAGNACATFFASEAAQLSASDWSDWQPVTITAIDPTATTSPVFYDIVSMRSATTMQLHIPRVGYSGTLAFEANWGTNVTNEHRVTANQSLIVGIGKSIDGEDVIATFPVSATDGDHASNPACTGCHSQLDPIKQYFRQSLTLFDHEQMDAGTIAQPAGFAFDGVTVSTGSGVSTLMSTLSTHPHMPSRWAEKLVFWANSTPAEEVNGTFDPEITRIATAFQNDNYNFYTLAQEVFSSPLVTFATPTQTTTDLGVLNSIARRDHYCAALSIRLGLTDVCGQNIIKTTSQQSQVAASATLLASDGYYRAYALPSLPTDPDLFFRSTVEAMCTTIAGEVVDVKSAPDAGAPTSKDYLSTDPMDAIADMVTTVMNIPASDPRNAPLQSILMDHFTNAQMAVDGGGPDGGAVAGANKTQAMQSTFILACTAPTSVLMGL